MSGQIQLQYSINDIGEVKFTAVFAADSRIRFANFMRKEVGLFGDAWVECPLALNEQNQLTEDGKLLGIVKNVATLPQRDFWRKPHRLDFDLVTPNGERTVCVSAPSADVSTIWVNAVAANMERTMFNDPDVVNNEVRELLESVINEVVAESSVVADSTACDGGEIIVDSSDTLPQSETPLTTLLTALTQEASDEVEPSVDHKVIKEGWVIKENHNVLHGLSRRYCRLMHGSLRLYLAEDDMEPLFAMALEGASVDAPLFKRRGHALKLDLTSEAGRKNKYHHFVLKFKDEEDLQEWNDAILTCVGPNPQHSTRQLVAAVAA